MASNPTGGGDLPSMEYVSNSVLAPLTGMNEFDLLGFMDDNSLIATLGIEPAVLTDDCHTKLVDSNASNYVDLLPPPPQQDTYNPVTQAHTTYYAIDTDLQFSNGGDIVLDETPLVNSDAAALNPILVTTAPPQDQPLTLTFTNDNQLIDSSVIILSAADVQETPLSIVEVKEDIPSPSVEVNTAPTTTATTNRGKPLKRCNRKRPQVGAESKDELPKTKPPRRRRPKKEKKYELEVELDDPEEEKKRQNAINAKKNRDKKKNMLQELGDKVVIVTKERDELLKEVEELKQREQILRSQLMSKYGVNLPNF